MVINQLLFIFSLIYLNYFEVYISEEKIYSYNNSSLLYFLPYLIIFYLLVILSSIVLNKQKNKIKQILDDKMAYPNRNLHVLIMFIVVVIMFFSYVNIFISGLPPIMSSGFISRFDYLYTTKLWFLLKYFGKVQLFIPIILGYFLLYNMRYHRTRKFISILFILYIFYLVMIGHKYGGPTQAIFLFFTPTVLYKIFNKSKILSAKLILSIASVAILIFMLIMYHYTNVGVDFRLGMTPIEFLFHRVFSLQSHLFWGVINYMEKVPISIQNLWNGMHNLMIGLAPPTIYKTIERGVNFTNGFPAILFISFPLIINYVMYILLLLPYFFFSVRMITNLTNMKYVLYAYFLIIYKNFITQGSLKILFEPKSLALIFLLFSYSLLQEFSFNYNKTKFLSKQIV